VVGGAGQKIPPIQTSRLVLGDWGRIRVTGKVSNKTIIKGENKPDRA
jgi:hypothetical protein